MVIRLLHEHSSHQRNSQAPWDVEKLKEKKTYCYISLSLKLKNWLKIENLKLFKITTELSICNVITRSLFNPSIPVCCRKWTRKLSWLSNNTNPPLHANFLRNIHLPDPSQDSFSLFKSQIYWPQVPGSHHILILTDQRECGDNSVKRRIFETWTCNLADDEDNEQNSMIQRFM
jgi:hypothetical protein